MKKSFLNANSPFATVILQERTGKALEYKIKNAVADGADAIAFQLSSMVQEDTTPEKIAFYCELTEKKPVYVTNYRGNQNEGKTDQELMQGLLTAVDCGATLVDIMGDTFCPSIDELTTDKKAIEKQMAVIEQVHEKGGEVIMSSHVYQYREAERVLEMALAQQQRGADIVKIVTGAGSEDEEMKNLEICRLLKKELSVPFLFLSSGKYSKLHRTLGPAFGVCMWLCFREYDDFTYPEPPLLKNVLQIKQGLKL